MSMTYESCEKKQQLVKSLFSQCTNEEEKYAKIIELGRKQPPLPTSDKTTANIVQGCQSTMYLTANIENGHVFFAGESDALISAGLSALLINVYSGETPEAILKCPPTYLDDLGIGNSLTPNRASGLYSIHLRMKQEALRLYMHQESRQTDLGTGC